ncbi:coiled-coil domain-containing protein 50 isoform X2 [Sceloporus undulatus]|nr:coiled-coil domain-containing protein 50 isoform X2 [Sceloporus undulatus]
MAKQLQEEEDQKARARVQERHKNIERQDCEIAQEIQVKLVIEAEQRRRQEEDDEDIARILQQKELQEEKRRKKPLPLEPISSSPYKEAYYPESRDHMCGSPRDRAPEHAGSHRPQNDDRQTQHPGDTWRGPPLISEGLDLEVLESSSEKKKARGGQQRDRERRERNPGHSEKPRMRSLKTKDEDSDRTKESRRKRNPESLERPWVASFLDGEDERTIGGGNGQWRERRSRSHERAQRPPRVLTEEGKGASSDRNDRHHQYRERRSPGSENSLRPLSLDTEKERRGSPYQRYGKSCSPNPDCRGAPSHEGQQSPRATSQEPRLKDPNVTPKRGHRRNIEKEYKGVGDRERPSSSSSHRVESRELHLGPPQNPGTKSKGTKETYSKPRPLAAQDQEFYDAEIARRLQEEELLANQVDTRAAQVAQDEEIARLLMAEEKKAYKKAKEREKSSSEKKKQEPDRKHDTHEGLHPRSREGHEDHRAKSDKPTRPPPPPTEELDHLVSLTSQQNLAYPISKPEPSHRGYHYKQ